VHNASQPQADKRLVGRYELLELIGEGAMAEVYRAYDPGIDRVLAIKLLKPELRANAEYAVRFLREAKAAGALSHPSIVTIYDVGDADGHAYIAMELLDGEPVDKLVARGETLSTEAVLAIAGQLAGALGYAHRAGVIHRDIKPSNIMLSADGRSVKLLDFGIARVADADAAEGALRTQIGQVLGTPRYMSPEQALGREIDGRSDLFSTGVVLYELVTGQHAFNGTSAATLALQITQQEPPSIASLAPNCPGGLRFIIEKLLSKRPERRFPDGADLARAVAREARTYEAVQAEDAARGWRLPFQLRVAAGMVVVTAIGLALAIGVVLDRQYQAMARMALASGSSIAAFVATNAALPAVDNATLPYEERDWLPVQAFISAASKDESVRWMTMVDNDGVIRGSSDPKAIGTRYTAPNGEAVVFRSNQVTVTDIMTADGRRGYRFVHPIVYAGQRFGVIEVSIDKAELLSAQATSRELLLALSVLVLAMVGAASYIGAHTLARPIRRLKQALRDATMGDLEFRISHRRRDEFGELFDAYNLFAATMRERLDVAARGASGPRSVDATQVDMTGIAPPSAAAGQGSPAATPFDPDWRRSA
jgi:serine/threonine-protein kinase